MPEDSVFEDVPFLCREGRGGPDLSAVEWSCGCGKRLGASFGRTAAGVLEFRLGPYPLGRRAMRSCMGCRRLYWVTLAESGVRVRQVRLD